MRCDADRLDDILKAIEKISQRMPNSVDVFLADELLQV